MNYAQRWDLDRLRERQERLEAELKALGREIELLGAKIGGEVHGPQSTVHGPQSTVHSPQSTVHSPRSPAPVPPPLPPIIPPRAVPSQNVTGTAPTPPDDITFHVPAAPKRSEGGLRFTSATPPPPASPTPAAPGPPPSQPRPSFEMRLGTYWLVRIGVVMVLTALVFFGNLAYQNYIRNFGPGGKLALLYAASALLLAAGAWWQRKAVKESLKNYAQVLFAGGLAAVYFTTYAAHHIEPLRVIASAGLDGALLLAWAGFMVWSAGRKKSEVLALFAVCLAYYASVITRAGLFTLWSNLVLTGAAVIFLVRHRWAVVSFMSLVASYAAYAFWRFFDGSNWHWPTPEQGLWTGAFFLMSYWLLFTVGVFASRDEKFAGKNRATFLSFNNGAFFSLFVLTMLQVQAGGFWKVSLVCGCALLVLALAALRLLPAEPLAKNFYLTQGLLLVTIGFISKFAGLQLALILAAESVVLFMLGTERRNWILRIGAYVAAGLSIGWGMDGLRQFDQPGLLLGMGLGALMIWNAIWSAGRPGPQHFASESPVGSTVRSPLLRPEPGYFSGLALLIWLVTTWDNVSFENFPLVLAAEALLLTLSIYLLRLREVTLFAQAFAMLGQGLFVSVFDIQYLHSSQVPPMPWWKPLLLFLATLALYHWWQVARADRRTPILPAEGRAAWLPFVCQEVYSLAAVGVLCGWFEPRVRPEVWLALTSLLCIALTAYGVVTRAWLLSASAQLLMSLSCWEFASQLIKNKPEWAFPLAPIAALALLSAATFNWFQRRPDPSGRIARPLLQIALIYRWVAVIMTIWWVLAYIPGPEQIWVLGLLGILTFAWAGLRKSPQPLLFSAAFALTALALFWLPLNDAPRVYWPNLLVIVAFFIQQKVMRDLPDRYALGAPASLPASHQGVNGQGEDTSALGGHTRPQPLRRGEGPRSREIQGAIILIAGVTLWRFVSLWVMEQASGFYLTASWSALALLLFAAGFVLAERLYRWLGLAILACALGRVVVFDVWKLETIYRILSFMALGIVLLVLGFIYNKYQEKIRQWL